jgi:hypothetical protein
VSLQELGTLIREGDAAGLGQAFSRAADWDSRETIVVAFGNLMAEHPVLSDGARAELKEALESVVALCRAEQGGGSYRENCLNTAQRLLGQVKEA